MTDVTGPEPLSERPIVDRLVSPNGFDGYGPVPGKVNEAARTLARLRVKFVNQWVPGANALLTVREVDDLFIAAATRAEWERELYEARDALATENRALRAVVERGPEWHAERFPTATVEHVALKLAEEAGEVCAAVIALAGNEHPERAASVVDECADVFIVLSVLVGRYFPFTPLMEAVQTKLAALSPQEGTDNGN